ncbi:MAG: amidase [Cyanobacteria bacterium P01_F01_bin.13]
MDVFYWSAEKIAKKIRAKDISSLDIVNSFIHRINSLNSTLNAVVTINQNGARERAVAADRAISKGELWGPLHGVPITVKDSYKTAGIKTTCNCNDYKDFIPNKNATIVDRLLNAGCIILGKTNLPVLSQDIQTDSAHFGRANNPWDTSRTTGGSTGGGAAAVSSGLSPLEIGSDLFGSVRLPAHFCGIFGFRPTQGRVSTAGLILGKRQDPRILRFLCSPGFLSRTVDDLKLCLDSVEGPDRLSPEVPPVYESPITQTDNSLQIAWIDQLPDVPTSADTKAAIKAFINDLCQAGHTTFHKLPPLDFQSATYTCGNLLGIESGALQNRLMRLLIGVVLNRKPASEPFLKGFAKGATALSMADYLQCLSVRDTFIREFDQFMQTYDAFICPVAPGPAFEHIKTIHPLLGPHIKVDDGTLPYWVWGISYSILASLTGHPVVVIPIGYGTNDLPIGIQLIGKRWQDRQLLDYASNLAKIVGPIKQPICQ